MSDELASRLIVALPTSPIRSHPDTGLIDRTIDSIRWQLGTQVLIVILADYPRPEMMEMLPKYHQYLDALEKRYRPMNYVIMKFLEFKHQVAMLRWLVNAPMAEKGKPHIVFVEADCPFTPDPIDWKNVCDMLDTKRFEMVRFLYEGDIHPEHRFMAGATVPFNGMNYVETRQFSARPHVATWDFYKRMLEQFSPEARTFTEDKMHSVVLEHPEDWKIGIYYPSPPRGRSFHLDGRQGDSKFEEKLIF